ncbi:phosphatidylserine decarboxylase (predicted), partial [Reticulomyxa filosa]
AFIFVHQNFHESHYLQLTVMDENVKNPAFGQGVLSAKTIFENSGGLQKDVPLSALQIELDKTLSSSNVWFYFFQKYSFIFSLLPFSLSFWQNSRDETQTNKQMQQLRAQETANPEHGILQVEVKLHEKEKVQIRYYEAMVDYFDENGNGELDKLEVEKLVLSLDIPEDPEKFFRKFDEDANEVWSKEEIVNMLKDYHFQRSPWLALALFHFLKHDEELKKYQKEFQEEKKENMKRKLKHKNWFEAHLMTGVTEQSQIGEERKFIKVKDRRTGLIIQENIPGYVWQALQLMYNSSTGRVFAKQIAPMLTKMSKDKGQEYDTTESAQEIQPFVDLHNLDMSVMVYSKVEDYKTFNDFFARPIRSDARPLHSPDNDRVLVSPADCRMVVFPNVVESSIWVKVLYNVLLRVCFVHVFVHVYIIHGSANERLKKKKKNNKGSDWTIENLLGKRYEAVGKNLEGGGFVIARLAPQDYHRFHWPVSGKVTKITPVDGALYTVNPIAINQPINVFTENKRCIIEIDTGEERFGSVVLIAVAATMVGSYLLFQKDGVTLEEGHDVVRGDVCGEFRFGGSTVLVLFQKGVVQFDSDLVRHSTQQLETLVQVKTRIGQKV